MKKVFLLGLNLGKIIIDNKFGAEEYSWFRVIRRRRGKTETSHPVRRIKQINKQGNSKTKSIDTAKHSRNLQYSIDREAEKNYADLIANNIKRKFTQPRNQIILKIADLK